MTQAIFMLIAAIISEVFGSSMLKKSNGFQHPLPTIGFLLGYLLAFVGLAFSLMVIPLGAAYAIWAGLGTALTAIAGVLFFKERLSIQKVIGIMLVVIGVVVLNIGG